MLTTDSTGHAIVDNINCYLRGKAHDRKQLGDILLNGCKHLI